MPTFGGHWAFALTPVNNRMDSPCLFRRAVADRYESIASSETWGISISISSAGPGGVRLHVAPQLLIALATGRQVDST